MVRQAHAHTHNGGARRSGRADTNNELGFFANDDLDDAFEEASEATVGLAGIAKRASAPRSFELTLVVRVS